MNFLRSSLVITCLLVLTSGCAVNLPFNNRVAFPTLQEAKAASAEKPAPIAIMWAPADFPDRVDIQGASGFVGSGTRTRIPTGPALCNRITEVLDTMVGVDQTTDNSLEITVLSAVTKFEYSAGFFNITPAIDEGACTFTAQFKFKELAWTNTYSAEEKDPTIGGSSQTTVLENVWDQIALQVGKDVATRIQPQ